MRQANPVLPIIACGALCMVVAYTGATTFLQTFLDPTNSHVPPSPAVLYLQAEGVLHGAAGDIEAERALNRAELLKLVLESVDYRNMSGSHCFEDVADEWFASYACTAKEAGMVAETNKLLPEQVVTIAETAKVLTMAYQIPVLQGKEWFDGPLHALQERGVLPVAYASPRSVVTRGDLFEMLYALSKSTDESTEE